MAREPTQIDPFKAPSPILFAKAFTLWTTWPSILLFTAFSTMIVFLDKHVTPLRLPSTILTVLGTVIGFVVSYRTSSAYERYTDGRKQWAKITVVGRTLARLIWLHCPNVVRLPTDSSPATETENVKGMIEKKSFINLIEGFAVSLKHYLRGEHGIYYEDLYHLACFLPKYAFPAGHPLERPDLGFIHDNPCGPAPTSAIDPAWRDQVSIQIDREPKKKPSSPSPARTTTTNPPTLKPPRELLPAHNPPKYINSFLAFFRSVWKGTKNAVGVRTKALYSRRIHDDNIPLEIIWCLDSYIATLQQRKVLDPSTINALLTCILSLSESLTNLERILTTPIPFGYIVHLKLVIWAYLLCLPFQLLSNFGYITIPAVAFVAIAFLGFLRVGEEIENPFGYDSNDLDMDHFCHNIIARELVEITAWPPPDPNVFMFSQYNMPLIGQRDCRSAIELAGAMGSAEEFQKELRTRQHQSSETELVKER